MSSDRCQCGCGRRRGGGDPPGRVLRSAVVFVPSADAAGAGGSGMRGRGLRVDRVGVELSRNRVPCRGVLHLGRRRPGTGQGTGRRTAHSNPCPSETKTDPHSDAGPFFLQLRMNFILPRTLRKQLFRCKNVLVIVWGFYARFTILFQRVKHERRRWDLINKKPRFIGFSPQKPG